MSHTPGPWTHFDNSWQIATVYSRDHEEICRLTICDDEEGEIETPRQNEHDANALLIAAARARNCGLRIADEAIAKAEGK